ncbi:MAG: ribbon-helix-helix domain-containing protein [Rickettsiales bacterium]|jgi:predicted DNA-binding ribbon-helix-helix protein|nr:ribbon-helix-helix domain-containing protein [Rickettsiales bacterium]
MKKLSVNLCGHKTSISLEPEFAAALKEISAARKIPVARIIQGLDSGDAKNLSSAIRVWILQQYV